MVEAKTHPHVLCRRGNCDQGQSGLRGQVYLFFLFLKEREGRKKDDGFLWLKRREGKEEQELGRKGGKKWREAKGWGGRKRFKAEAQSRCWCWWWWMQLVEMQSCYHETHSQPPHCTLSPLMSVCVFEEKEQEGGTETSRMAKSFFSLQSCWLWVKNLLLSAKNVHQWSQRCT